MARSSRPNPTNPGRLPSIPVDQAIGALQLHSFRRAASVARVLELLTRFRGRFGGHLTITPRNSFEYRYARGAGMDAEVAAGNFDVFDGLT